MTCSSPDCRSTCLIHFPSPLPELELPPLLPTCAISNPFPTGKNTDRTSRREPPSSTTLFHLNPEAVFDELAFLQTKTAPLLLSLANLNTLAKSFLLQSTTKKSIPATLSITVSGSPTMTSGDIPASFMAASYSDLDLSSGTMHAWRPFVWRLATAKPMLIARGPPCDHVSTMNFAFQPAAMAETSSATPDS